MENEGNNLQGFSNLPEKSEFKNDMKRFIRKNFKFALVTIPIIYILAVNITAIVTGVRDEVDWRIVFPVAKYLISFFLGLAIIVLILLFFNLMKIKRDGVDGKVLTKKEQGAPSGDTKSSKKKRLVVIQTDSGKKISIKGKKAVAVYDYISEGDKVRFHPGYPFPIEIYDKTKKGKNICVFCGTENDLAAKKCRHCDNLMLI